MGLYDVLVKKILKRAEELGVYVVARIQRSKTKYIMINNGKTEEMFYNHEEGIGIHVFTMAGGCGFVSSEEIEKEKVIKMVELAADMAREIERRGGKLNREIFKLKPVVDELYAKVKYSFDEISLEDEETNLIYFNKGIITTYPGISMETLYQNVVDCWRIVRSDGTDITFDIPRAVIYNGITARGTKTATTKAALSGVDASILLDEDKKEKLIKRTQLACQLAIDLLEAPKIKGGNYKLIIDYALAKGLAHEAFGHAVETDGMKMSILSDRKGKFRTGEQVASPIVSIIDESIEGDYAYQPYSANGVKRKRTEIVKEGILKAALGDVFSAGDAGVEMTGAGRAESYRHIPLPRMSNIRIEIANPVEVYKEFEEITPEELYHLLIEHKYIHQGEKVLYLTGYRGGQVKTSQGEFVFNCSGIYELGESCKLYQPAIFSGKILSALASIKGAVGPLLLNAQGTCGKAGQSVPSSGGSHYYVILDANKDIIIGGE